MNTRKYILEVRQYVVFWAVFIVILIPFGWSMLQSYQGVNRIIDNLYLESSSVAAFYINQAMVDEPDAILSRTALEFDTLTNRNARSISFIATRTWLRFMSSAFGGIMIFVGAVFILSKIEAGETKVGGTSGDVSISVMSTSPGIILAVIGAVLIVSPNFSNQPISTDDTASYFSKSTSIPAGDSGVAVRPADTPEGRSRIQELFVPSENDGENQ